MDVCDAVMMIEGRLFVDCWSGADGVSQSAGVVLVVFLRDTRCKTLR